MADLVKRISDKSQIEMGTEESKVSGSDIFLIQHTTGDNKDYSVPLNYIQAIPVGKTDTASGTATKVVTLLNYPSGYDFVIGSKILVTFTNANTSTTQLYFTIGDMTKPVTVKGFALKSAIPSGSQIEFTYTGTSFNCQDFAISTIDTSTTQPVNSSAVNGALANQTELKIEVKTDANKCIPTVNYNKIFYVSYTGTNVPVYETNKSNWFISTMWETGVQLRQNAYRERGTDKATLNKFNQIYTRSAYLNGNTWIFSDWQEVITETSLSSTLANYQEYIKGNVAKGETKEVTISAFRGLMQLYSNDESAPALIMFDGYRTGYTLVSGTIPSYVTITHQVYTTKVTIINNATSNYLIHYSVL